MASLYETNPFPGDPDRHEIWEILVRRDIDAFLAADWSRTENDFYVEEFWALDGGFTSRPDHWRLSFPDLPSYRDYWLASARDFQGVELIGASRREFVYRTTILRDIDIQAGRAVARKKFCGECEKVGGGKLSLNWQTLYFLKRVDGKWKITGFLGYLASAM